jgi:hypothetical protein
LLGQLQEWLRKKYRETWEHGYAYTQYSLILTTQQCRHIYHHRYEFKPSLPELIPRIPFKF